MNSLRIAQTAWLGLIVLTLVWDGFYAPLGTGRVLLVVKLLPLLLPFRGILSGRIYTYQYCSMLIMLYFIESIMRFWDIQAASRMFSLLEMLLAIGFFSGCLKYVSQFKTGKEK